MCRIIQHSLGNRCRCWSFCRCGSRGRWRRNRCVGRWWGRWLRWRRIGWRRAGRIWPSTTRFFRGGRAGEDYRTGRSRRVRGCGWRGVVERCGSRPGCSGRWFICAGSRAAEALVVVGKLLDKCFRFGFLALGQTNLGWVSDQPLADPFQGSLDHFRICAFHYV